MKTRQNMEQSIREVSNRTSFATYEHHAELREILKYLIEMITAKSSEDLDHALLAFPNSLYKLLQVMFLEYQKPECHAEPVGFMQSRIGRRVDFDDNFLVDLSSDKIEKHFIELYPFLPILRELHVVRSTRLEPEMLVSQLKILANEISKYLHHYEVILPIQQMVSFIELAIGASRVEDLNLALAMFAVVVKKWVPYHKRDKSTGEVYYKDVNWRSLEVISELAFMPAYASFSKDNFHGIIIDLSQFLVELRQLELYEQARYNGGGILAPTHTPFKVLHYWEQYYSDIENLTYMKDCVATILLDLQDSRVFRLAVLRVLTILGEGIKNISLTLQEAHPILEQVKPVRNEIIHQRNYNARVYLHLLLNEQTDQSLSLLARNDFPTIVDLLNQLIIWRTANPIITTAVSLSRGFVFPRLSEFCVELTHEFRLTRPERDYLLTTLPVVDAKRTTEKRDQLKVLLEGRDLLPHSCEAFIECFNGYGISKGVLKDCFVKLRRLEGLRSLYHGVRNTKITILLAKQQLASIITQAVKKENIEVWLKELGSIDNIEALLAFIVKFSETLQVSQATVVSVVAKIPEEEIDLRPLKSHLIDCIQQRQPLPSERDFIIVLDKLGINASVLLARNAWLNAYTQLARSNVVIKLPNFETIFKKTRQLINQIIRGIEEIRLIMEPLMREEPRQAFRKFIENKNLFFACEMLLGRFLHAARNLVELLDQVKDYSDLEPDFFNHPIDELIKELKNYLQYRNNIFHLDNLYTHIFKTEIARQSRLYDYMEYLTLGTFYPEAIVIYPDTVRREPLRTNSLICKLRDVQQEIINYENKIIECRQQLYWQHLGQSPLLPMFKMELSLWKRYEETRRHQEASAGNSMTIILYRPF